MPALLFRWLSAKEDRKAEEQARRADMTATQ